VLVKMVSRELQDKDFALCPENGYPRLIRYDLPWSEFGLVSALDFEKNLLRVCKELYDKLDDAKQNMVLKTRKEFVYLHELQDL